jgi:hypothetical protein
VTRRASEVIKTKSAVKPRESQRTVLNLECPELSVSGVEDTIICALDGKTKWRFEECGKFHMGMNSVL